MRDVRGVCQGELGVCDSGSEAMRIGCRPRRRQVAMGGMGSGPWAMGQWAGVNHKHNQYEPKAGLIW